jgi:ferredoxin
MSASLTLTDTQLSGLIQDLLSAGTAVLAPATTNTGGLDYRPINAWEEARPSGPLPLRPLKAQFLPPTEPLFGWQQHRKDVTLQPVSPKFRPRVIIGARPCDAAAVQILDKVMGWDYKDEPWFGRRDATTILGMACTGGDSACFCETVGLTPSATKGSDLFLTPAEIGFSVEVVTEKGRHFVDAHQGRFAEATSPAPAAKFAPQAPRFSVETVHTWLATHFGDPLWQGVALKCHGCGACAAVCPTCHCFDIVDEPDGVDRGVRRRNWDTCQTGRFTVHASGHNPRANQDARYRQRVLHKFSIYPERFGEILCTGCGRCTRACPSGMDIAEVLSKVQAEAQTSTRAANQGGGQP